MSIDDAAQRLVELRDGWLKARPDRTLTGLYNEQPVWLGHAHGELDRAVLAAYGWSADIVEEDLLYALLDLNSQRASEVTSSDS